MFKYNLQEVNHELSNDLRIDELLKSPKGWLRNSTLLFTNKTDIRSIKLYYEVSFGWNFQIKRLYCPWCPNRVAQKCNFVILRIKLDRKQSKHRAVRVATRLGFPGMSWICTVLSCIRTRPAPGRQDAVKMTTTVIITIVVTGVMIVLI